MSSDYLSGLKRAKSVLAERGEHRAASLLEDLISPLLEHGDRGEPDERRLLQATRNLRTAQRAYYAARARRDSDAICNRLLADARRHEQRVDELIELIDGGQRALL